MSRDKKAMEEAVEKVVKAAAKEQGISVEEWKREALEDILPPGRLYIKNGETGEVRIATPLDIENIMKNGTPIIPKTYCPNCAEKYGVRAYGSHSHN